MIQVCSASTSSILFVDAERVKAWHKLNHMPHKLWSFLVVQTKAMQFLKRRENNLRFFEHYYPEIYRYFVNFQHKRSEVVLSNTEDEVDLYLDGQSLYQGKGNARAKQGVELFKNTFAEHKILTSQPPPWPGIYRHPRFAHSAVDRIARLSPLKKDQFKGYPIPNFYPLVVFQGVGLGYQIEELIKSDRVENAIILEPEEEIFGASLLTIDWKAICSHFNKPGRSIRFIIGTDSTESNLWPILMHNLMLYTPIFPIMNLFINDRGDPVMDAVAKRLNREAMASLSTWGHYDDELRQINNALHAFHLGIKIIPSTHSVKSKIPVLIIGSGPSIDERIEDVKKVREKSIVVSAGSGIKVLLANDIYPDFHVELESDYFTHQVINSYDHKKLKNIRLIAASQICPLTWQLFGESRLYFKKENPIGSMFGTPDSTISLGAPSCTNAAIALCAQLGLENLYFFGTDFGFTEHENHHSKKSVYSENSNQIISEKLKRSTSETFKKKNTFLVPGVKGSFIHTTPFYFTSKRLVENLIISTRKTSPNCQFYNCADGAEIEGAEWMSRESFLKKVCINTSKEERLRVINKIFSSESTPVPLESLKDQITKTTMKLKELSEKLESLLKKRRLCGKKDITRICSEISRYVEGQLQREDQGFYYMIRGTIRHFLYVGLSHALAMKDDHMIDEFLGNWKEGFITCMKQLPSHFQSITEKEYSLEDDTWVRRSIDDPE